MFDFLKLIEKEVKAVNRFTGEVYVSFTCKGSFLEHTMFEGNEPGVFLTEVYVKKALEDICWWCADVEIYTDDIFIEHQEECIL